MARLKAPLLIPVAYAGALTMLAFQYKHPPAVRQEPLLSELPGVETGPVGPVRHSEAIRG